jgi:hypothetical protein
MIGVLTRIHGWTRGCGCARRTRVRVASNTGDPAANRDGSVLAFGEQKAEPDRRHNLFPSLRVVCEGSEHDKKRHFNSEFQLLLLAIVRESAPQTERFEMSHNRLLVLCG